MEYKPGLIHESFQKKRYYIIRNGFVFGKCEKRYSEFVNIEDWDNCVTYVDLKVNDIIEISYFKYGNSMDLYCYLYRVINSEGITIHNRETFTSYKFLEANSKIFEDITKSFERDSLISIILND